MTCLMMSAIFIWADVFEWDKLFLKLELKAFSSESQGTLIQDFFIN